MDIVVLAEPEGRIIGREVHSGQTEGEFVLEADGSVTYRSPHDQRQWYAAPSAIVFRQAAECWHRYGQRVTQMKSEEEQLGVVAQLRNELQRLGLLGAEHESVWSVLVEQAEYGHL
jgi:hypothetical protein